MSSMFAPLITIYDETREQIEKLWEANIRKIGVIYQDDAFGKTVLDGVKLALQKAQLCSGGDGHVRAEYNGCG